jgi:hypothetical protein
MRKLSTNRNCLPDATDASLKADCAQAIGNVIHFLTLVGRIACKVLAAAIIFCLLGFPTGTAHAGCHVGDVSWYNDYHHGFRTVRIDDLDRPRIEHSILVYEYGELRSIPNPLPAPCNGRDCRNAPGNEMGLSITLQTRVVSLAFCLDNATQIYSSDSLSESLQFSNELRLPRNPNELLEPPRQ